MKYIVREQCPRSRAVLSYDSTSQSHCTPTPATQLSTKRLVRTSETWASFSSTGRTLLRFLQLFLERYTTKPSLPLAPQRRSWESKSLPHPQFTSLVFIITSLIMEKEKENKYEQKLKMGYLENWKKKTTKIHRWRESKYKMRPTWMKNNGFLNGLIYINNAKTLLINWSFIIIFMSQIKNINLI